MFVSTVAWNITAVILQLMCELVHVSEWDRLSDQRSTHKYWKLINL
jgi:hypothetical protein